VRRFVVKPTGAGLPAEEARLAALEPLDDTGLFLAEAADPRALVEGSEGIAWAGPTLGNEGEESYPTGEVSIRFGSPLEIEDIEAFVHKHALELRRRNEFVPEQVVVAPTEPLGTWLPDLVERLNGERLVDEAWPNTRSRYRRV
jgi:hypothetical protein